ncbi:MAG: DNA polymerase IV [Plesiomonas sp.]|uniref:DNA polymerase IV n=1 Tax=Plesiomonas sp. TaxID=2486279 RepID=UPI003F3E83A8
MRKIIHIDMDCFYAAVEMRDNPTLQHVPLAIGGRRERRGVLSTCNYVARSFGLHSAMPTAQAFKLCPHLTLLPGRMDVYKRVSQQLHAIFRRYTDKVEPLSLDEAYLDVTDCTLFQGSATWIAEDIRRAIRDELQLTASAGVASVKFLAKIASDMNKPNGLYVLRPEQTADFVATLPLKKIPGVGKVSAQKLADMGLFVCADVQRVPLTLLADKFGKMGQMLWQRCQGIDDREVNATRQRKSVGVERTLEEDIHSLAACQQIVRELYPELERRLSQASESLAIARQGVKLKFSDFQLTTQEHVYPHLDQQDLLQLAESIWSRCEGRGVRLVGLHVTLIDPQLVRQLALPWS